MSTQEKSAGTLSSAFTKGEYGYRRRGSAVATGDIRITDPKPSADLNIVMDPQPFPRRLLGRIRSFNPAVCNQRVIELPNAKSASRGATTFEVFARGSRQLKLSGAQIPVLSAERVGRPSS